jgi:hypothetical protein
MPQPRDGGAILAADPILSVVLTQIGRRPSKNMCSQAPSGRLAAAKPRITGRAIKRTKPVRLINWRRILALGYNLLAWAAIIAIVWAIKSHLR